MTEKTGRALQVSEDESSGQLPSETSIQLTDTKEINLSGLPQSQIEQLRTEYAKGMIDIHKKAAELKVDVAALAATLDSLTDQTRNATEVGAHTTITHTQKTSIGTTEVMMGNTDRAAKGKISRFAAGEQDKTIWIVGIIAAAAILVAMIMAG